MNTYFDLLPLEIIEYIDNFLDQRSHNNISRVVPVFQNFEYNKRYHKALLKDIVIGKGDLYFGHAHIIPELEKILFCDLYKTFVKVSDNLELRKVSQTWEPTRENGFGMDNLLEWEEQRRKEKSLVYSAKPRKVRYIIKCMYEMYISCTERRVFIIFRLKGTENRRIDRAEYILRVFISIIDDRPLMARDPIKVLNSGWGTQLQNFIKICSGEDTIKLPRCDFESIVQTKEE